MRLPARDTNSRVVWRLFKAGSNRLPRVPLLCERTIAGLNDSWTDALNHDRWSQGLEAEMSGRWVALILIVGLTTTLLNLMILIGHLSTPATARAGTGASKLLDDEDFQEGLSKIIRKTVRTYCTVSKREGIDC
jgi:hypothetical protein